MQNWNDGKAQEFKDRKVYDVANSVLTHEGALPESAACAFAADLAPETAEILLFATKTCPNCALAKSMLAKANIEYRVVDAEENKELTVAHGVKKAPTLLVPTAEGYVRYENASEIRRYIENR